MSTHTSFYNYLKYITSINFLPRWIILLLDIFIVFFSFIFVTYLLGGMGIELKQKQIFSFPLYLYLFVNIFTFWLFKVYSGIIRHSTVIDAINIFYSQFLTITLLVFINYCYDFFSGDRLFLSTKIFLSGINSFIFLVVYRLIIKSFFELVKRSTIEKERVKVLIYGIDERAIAAANAIKEDSSSPYFVKGFINKDSKTSISRILNTPVFGINRRPSVIARKLKADAVLLSDLTLTTEEKHEIVNDCIENNIKVLYLPSITDYRDSKKIIANIKNIKIQDLLERKEIAITNDKISKDLFNKVVLVTGAAGSIGSEIVYQVAKFSPKILILLDQAETPLHNISLEIEKVKKDTEIINVIGDIRNIEDIEHVFQNYKPEVVYHAAAYKHVPLMERNPSQAIFTNVEGSRNIIDLSVKYFVKRFVMVSTDKAVNPSNVMGASKRIAEKYVQCLAKQFGETHQTRFITTRFGNVLGSNGSVVPLFTKQIEEGGPITITHPDIIRYFMTIPEACQLVLEAGSMGNGGEIYIFDMGKAVKIIDLAHKMIRLAGLVPEKDIKIEVVGLRPGEKLYEELLYDTSKTLPTYHEKIMIANDVFEDFENLNIEIEKLINLAHLGLKLDVVKQMKKIAPEFVSLNSEYSKLD